MVNLRHSSCRPKNLLSLPRCRSFVVGCCPAPEVLIQALFLVPESGGPTLRCHPITGLVRPEVCTCPWFLLAWTPALGAHVRFAWPTVLIKSQVGLRLVGMALKHHRLFGTNGGDSGAPTTSINLREGETKTLSPTSSQLRDSTKRFVFSR